MPEERYSKEAVKRAGKLLVSDRSSWEEAAQARKVVDYWRTIHAEALQRALADIESSTADMASALVAGRIKKYDTIIDKLGRLRTARLHTLHDIAGCRIVVPSLNDLLHMSNALSRLTCFDADKSSRYDYIAAPKTSGYRGQHVILKYTDLSCGQTLFVEV